MADLIDREKLLEKIYGSNPYETSIVKCIKDQPPTDTERHAHWIRYEHNSGIHCSKCNHKARYKDIHRFEYCPHCGCKMDEVKE